VAAAPPRLRPILQGILAIGFTREEEYAHVRATDPDATDPWTTVQLYDLVPDLGRVPIAVIQSTHDQYLPAADARELFGPDTPTRRFIAIEAADHNFGDARTSMYDELHRNLDWLCGSGRR